MADDGSGNGRNGDDERATSSPSTDDSRTDADANADWQPDTRPISDENDADLDDATASSGGGRPDSESEDEWDELEGRSSVTSGESNDGRAAGTDGDPGAGPDGDRIRIDLSSDDGDESDARDPDDDDAYAPEPSSKPIEAGDPELENAVFVLLGVIAMLLVIARVVSIPL